MKRFRHFLTEETFPAHMSVSDIIRHTLQGHFKDDRHPDLSTISARKTKQGTQVSFHASSSVPGHHHKGTWDEVYGNQSRYFKELPEALSPIAKNVTVSPAPTPGDANRHLITFDANYTHEKRDFHLKLNAELKKRGVPMAVTGDQSKIKYNKDGSKDVKIKPHPWDSHITAAHVAQVKDAIKSLHHDIIKDDSGWLGAEGRKPANVDPTHITDAVELRYRAKPISADVIPFRRR